MYNFRYHLVTICSIFVALALGLLLGAAIASSDLAQATSDDMVESMLSRYETLVDDNASLGQELQDTTALATNLTDYWSDERLKGRTIALLLGNTAEDTSLQNDLTDAINQAGGSVVSVTVLRSDFGLGDEGIYTALQGVVETAPGEEYQQTLAKQLAVEWSSVNTSATMDSVQEDFDTPQHTYIQSASESTATSGVTGESLAVAVDSSSALATNGPEPQTELQKIFYDQYPLTRALLALGIISVDADYTLLSESTAPSPTTDQQAAFQIATAWQLPYGINGLVNGLAQKQNDTTTQTQIGLQLTLSFQEAGVAGNLIYPSWLKTSIPKSTSGNVALPNYFAVLIQPSHLESSMDTLASENGLSCVTSPEILTGRYSIIALLTGAQAGIYGEDRSAESRFAPLPEDTSGRSVFK